MTKTQIRSAVGWLVLSLLLAGGGCRTNSADPAVNSAAANDLLVSAAVSLKDVFIEIGEIYKARTGGRVSFNFGASGTLQRQIETDAPIDLFASAGAAQMDALAAKNLIDGATRRDFARNTLVLIVPQNSKLKLTAFDSLTESDVRKIAVGNPKTVPAGQYAEQFLARRDLKTRLEAKLIFAEDVRQVLDYVVRGEVDAGIVYASDARSAGAQVRIAETAPEESHAPILYPVAVVADSKNKQSAQIFVDLLQSAEGQAVLRKYGFAGIAEK